MRLMRQKLGSVQRFRKTYQRIRTDTYQYITIVAILVPVLCGSPVQSLFDVEID